MANHCVMAASDVRRALAHERQHASSAASPAPPPLTHTLHPTPVPHPAQARAERYEETLSFTRLANVLWRSLGPVSAQGMDAVSDFIVATVLSSVFQRSYRRVLMHGRTDVLECVCVSWEGGGHVGAPEGDVHGLGGFGRACQAWYVPIPIPCMAARLPLPRHRLEAQKWELAEAGLEHASLVLGRDSPAPVSSGGGGQAQAILRDLAGVWGRGRGGWEQG